MATVHNYKLGHWFKPSAAGISSGLQAWDLIFIFAAQDDDGTPPIVTYLGTQMSIGLVTVVDTDLALLWQIDLQLTHRELGTQIALELAATVPWPEPEPPVG